MVTEKKYSIWKQTPLMIFLGVIFFLAVGASFSQDQVPKFSIESLSTLHELRVLDSEGNIVTGLTSDQITVLESGKPCEIRYFEERRNSSISIAILLDIGSSMNSSQIVSAKDAISEFIHLLEPDDEILIAVYDHDLHPLSSLTSNRYELNESIENISPGGRPNFFARLTTAFGTSAHTGYAVDIASLELDKALHTDRIVLVFSAAFGNIGVATEEHLALADISLFGVKWPNKLGDAFNFWGDWAARGMVLEKSGGIQFSGKTISEKVQSMVDSIKSYYLIAYTSNSQEELELPGIDIKITGQPAYQVFASRKTPSAR